MMWSLRDFQPADAPALRALFHAAVHARARSEYTQEQRDAWAPASYDTVAWSARLEANRPFVARMRTEDGAVHTAGFSDLQPTGYIDHFFVAPAFAGQGVARALMAHIHAQARQRGIARLWADVSLTAEPFFAKSGFAVEVRQQVERGGVVLSNARMAKQLPDPAGVGQ